MTLRYARWMPIALLVIGILSLIMAWFGAPGLIISGVPATLLGALMLRTPMIRFADSEIQVLSPVGMVRKRFAVTSPADVRVDGSSLMHVATGKKIVGLGFGAEKADAERIRAWAQQAA